MSRPVRVSDRDGLVERRARRRFSGRYEGMDLPAMLTPGEFGRMLHVNPKTISR
jgi:hypothetical protein